MAMRIDELKVKIRMMRVDSATPPQALINTMADYIQLLERELTVLRGAAASNSEKLAQFEKMKARHDRQPVSDPDQRRGAA